MCWKLCGKRLNAGGCTTATCARTSAERAHDLRRSTAARSRCECADRTARTPAAAPSACPPGTCASPSRRCSSLCGSGSPVSTWPEISGSTSARHAKFSMNWLGSSTASHATPLMPAMLGIVDAREHVMQAVAELVEHRHDFGVREERGLRADRRHEVAHQIGDRQRRACSRAACGRRTRPSTRRRASSGARTDRRRSRRAASRRR